MATLSAGILLYRRSGDGFEVLLAHPGGPFWAHKDLGVWSLPKGEVEPGEEPLAAALREFSEELGPPAAAALAGSQAEPLALGEVRLKSGKRVVGFALEGDLDPAEAVSNTIVLTVRGRSIEVPEVDRVAWFTPEQARDRLNVAQAAFIDVLAARLAPDAAEPGPGAGEPAAQPEAAVDDLYP